MINNEIKQYNISEYSEYIINPLQNKNIIPYNYIGDIKFTQNIPYTKKMNIDNLNYWKCRSDISRPWFFCEK